MTLDKSNLKIEYKKLVGYLLTLGLTGLLLYIAFAGVDLNAVFYYVSRASLFWIIIFLLIIIIAHYLRAYRWKIILKSVKEDVSTNKLFGAIMMGYGVNCVVPRLGEISRAVLIGRTEGISRSSAFGTVIVERVIDMLFLGIAVIFSVYAWGGSLFENFPWLKTTIYITTFIMMGLCLFLYLTIRLKEKFYNLIIKVITKISEKSAQKLSHIFKMLVEGFASLKGTKNYIATFTISVAIMFLYALSSYVAFFIFEETNSATFLMGWVMMSISSIGVVIPTPGGTGSYHTLAKSVMVLLFGFGEEISLAYAFLTHIISYSSSIIFAAVIFIMTHAKLKSIFTLESNGDNE